MPRVELGMVHLVIRVYLRVPVLYDAGEAFSCSGSGGGGGSGGLSDLTSFPRTTGKSCQQEAEKP